MSGMSKDGGFTPFRQSFFIRSLLFPLGILYRLWTASIRFQQSEENNFLELSQNKDPLVIFLWHNRLFLAGEWHNRFQKQKTCYGLISASKDGSWLETFYGWAGIRPVRGSQNRRGSQAIRELVRVVRGGNNAGITPDGSRGPMYEAKAGALAVARLTKSPLLLLSFEFTACLRLNSWDRFVIPYPFSRVIVRTRIISKEQISKMIDDQEATEFAKNALMEMTFD